MKTSYKNIDEMFTELIRTRGAACYYDFSVVMRFIDQCYENGLRIDNYEYQRGEQRQVIFNQLVDRVDLQKLKMRKRVENRLTEYVRRGYQ